MLFRISLGLRVSAVHTFVARILDVAIVLLANASMGEATQIYEKLITAVVDTVLDGGVSN